MQTCLHNQLIYWLTENNSLSEQYTTFPTFTYYVKGKKVNETIKN